MRTPPEVRFWPKVTKGPGCWEFRGAPCGPSGHRQFHDGERGTLAHRFSYAVHFGPIPDGVCVCHRCDNPACVRPDHLFLGSQAENLADMVRKGRSSSGGRHWNAKLTSGAVAEIRRLAETGMQQKDIAALFGVSGTAVHKIIHRKRWAKDGAA